MSYADLENKIRTHERILQDYHSLQTSLEGPAVPEDSPEEDIVALDRSLASSLLQQYQSLLASLEEIHLSATLCIENTLQRKTVASTGPGLFLHPPSKIVEAPAPIRKRNSEPRTGAGKQLPPSISSKLSASSNYPHATPPSPLSPLDQNQIATTSSDTSSPNGALSQGTKVASLVPSGDWILTRVVTFDAKTDEYVVEDEEAEADGNKFYTLPRNHVIELPIGKPLSLHKNEHVLAMYPDSTTFYSATIVRKAREHFLLHFADDEDETGLTPQRKVHQHYCMRYPNL